MFVDAKAGVVRFSWRTKRRKLPSKFGYICPISLDRRGRKSQQEWTPEMQHREFMLLDDYLVRNGTRDIFGQPSSAVFWDDDYLRPGGLNMNW